MELYALCVLASDAANKVLEADGDAPAEDVVALAGYMKALAEGVMEMQRENDRDIAALESELRELRDIIDRDQGD